MSVRWRHEHLPLRLAHQVFLSNLLVIHLTPLISHSLALVKQPNLPSQDPRMLVFNLIPRLPRLVNSSLHRQLPKMHSTVVKHSARWHFQTLKQWRCLQSQHSLTRQEFAHQQKSWAIYLLQRTPLHILRLVIETCEFEQFCYAVGVSVTRDTRWFEREWLLATKSDWLLLGLQVANIVFINLVLGVSKHPYLLPVYQVRLLRLQLH